MSDLHLEQAALDAFRVVGDVLVIAGDLATNPQDAGAFFVRIPAHVPCVYVLGNHEHDKRPFPALAAYRERLRTLPHVSLLENEAIEIGGVRFLGATLWSKVERHQYADVARTMERVDTRATPARITAIHESTVRWLERTIPSDTPTVVVTHMSPSHRSAPPRHADSSLSSYFATDLEDVVARTQPDLWIHGHMHDPVDYRIHHTRIVSNPRGYPGENREFSPAARVIEVSAKEQGLTAEKPRTMQHR